uniref:Uncharacterized protein n=1 Tax=Rhizophora mucronata TaxID=61149 RepID=A0A2P2P0N7_RHIMU
MSINPNPTNINTQEKTFVAGVNGAMSPYPIVHIVTIQK